MRIAYHTAKQGYAQHPYHVTVDLKPPHPQVLKHALVPGGMDGPNGFEWRKGRLHFNIEGLFDPSDPSSAEPLDSDWLWFWSECDRIGVWALPSTLPSRAIDGSRVYTTLAYAGRNLATSGEYSCAPREIGQTVKAFHRTLQRLVGYTDTA